MARFALGIVLGMALGALATWLVLRPKPKAEPRADVAVAPETGPTPATGKKKKPRRGGGAGAGGASAGADDGSEADQPEVSAPILGPADLATISEGDALKVPARTMDLAPGAEEPRDLTRSEIDAAIAPHEAAITACVERAAGDAEVTGKVTAGVVVSADGSVSKTRIEGPAYLLRHGLGGCVRQILRGLDFPATGKASVVRYPFHVS